MSVFGLMRKLLSREQKPILLEEAEAVELVEGFVEENIDEGFEILQIGDRIVQKGVQLGGRQTGVFFKRREPRNFFVALRPVYLRIGARVFCAVVDIRRDRADIIRFGPLSEVNIESVKELLRPTSVEGVGQ